MSELTRRRWLGAAGWLAALAAAGGTDMRSPAVASAQAGSAESLLAALKSARVFDLSFTWSDQSPVLNLNPPYSFALNRTHQMTHEIFGQVPGSRVSWAVGDHVLQRPARRADHRRHRPHRARSQAARRRRRGRRDVDARGHRREPRHRQLPGGPHDQPRRVSRRRAPRRRRRRRSAAARLRDHDEAPRRQPRRRRASTSARATAC